MSIFSSILGLNKTPTTSVDPMMRTATANQGANADQDRNQFLSLMGGGQNALNTSISAAMSAAMPSFNASMQGMQESGVRRGISSGDLETANEGSLASAFQRNIANSAGSQAMNMFGTQLGAAGSMYQGDENRFLGAMGNERDYQTAQANYKRQRSSGLFGGLGAALGGKFGGSTGSAIGGALGGLLGG